MEGRGRRREGKYLRQKGKHVPDRDRKWKDVCLLGCNVLGRAGWQMRLKGVGRGMVCLHGRLMPLFNLSEGIPVSPISKFV